MSAILILALVGSIFADSRVGRVTIITRTLASGATYVYPNKIDVGLTAVQAFDWHVTPASGTASVNVIMLQSNSLDGPFTSWATPLDGSTVVNNVTITSTIGGSPWRLTPGEWTQPYIRNSAAASVDVTLRIFTQKTVE